VKKEGTGAEGEAHFQTLLHVQGYEMMAGETQVASGTECQTLWQSADASWQS
jgi:hypothetical protein